MSAVVTRYPLKTAVDFVKAEFTIYTDYLNHWEQSLQKKLPPDCFYRSLHNREIPWSGCVH